MMHLHLAEWLERVINPRVLFVAEKEKDILKI